MRQKYRATLEFESEMSIKEFRAWLYHLMHVNTDIMKEMKKGHVVRVNTLKRKEAPMNPVTGCPAV